MSSPTAPDRPLRFGLMYLQSAPWDDLMGRIRRGEEMGFDSLWVADHMTGQYPGLIAYEAWTLLGTIAARTSRARIGTLVTPITFRHPALLAMSATTVDHASGGRLEIGLGIGGGPIDDSIVGVTGRSGPERVARLEEQVILLDRLLRGEPVRDHDGFYPTSGAVIEPSVQRPRPPIVIAGDGPRLIDLAARRGDAWNTLGGQPMRSTNAGGSSMEEAVEVTRRRVVLLDEACDRVGRDPRALRRMLLAYRVDPKLFLSRDAFSDYVGRYRETGIDEFVFYWPFHQETFARVPAYEEGLERIAGTVIPALRRPPVPPH